MVESIIGSFAPSITFGLTRAVSSIKSNNMILLRLNHVVVHEDGFFNNKWVKTLRSEHQRIVDEEAPSNDPGVMDLLEVTVENSTSSKIDIYNLQLNMKRRLDWKVWQKRPVWRIRQSGWVNDPESMGLPSGIRVPNGEIKRLRPYSRVKLYRSVRDGAMIAENFSSRESVNIWASAMVAGDYHEYKSNRFQMNDGPFGLMGAPKGVEDDIALAMTRVIWDISISSKGAERWIRLQGAFEFSHKLSQINDADHGI